MEHPYSVGKFQIEQFDRRLFRLGRPINGVWHTGVGVYGREYLFGSSGVSYTPPEEVYRQGLTPKPKV